MSHLDTCSQKRDAGICPGNVPRFYFDKKLGRCQLFTYGGCGGNSNNFAYLDDCVANCGGPSNVAGIRVRPQLGIFRKTMLSREALLISIKPFMVIFDFFVLGGVIKPRNAICNLAISMGTCKATLRRFYFDSRSGTCKLFIFGGCQGIMSENRFNLRNVYMGI